MAVDVTVGDGNLLISGTQEDDRVEIQYVDGHPDRSQLEIKINESRSEIVGASQIVGIVFNGEAGDDFIQNDTYIPLTANGGDGNDRIKGGAAGDHLYGNNGDDVLEGRNGDDIIFGGRGKDSVYGNEGNDQVYGGSGDDVVSGSSGDDKLYGDAGNDTLKGGAGNDYLNDSRGGNNTLYGGDGDDLLLQPGTGTYYQYAHLDSESEVNVVYGGHGNDNIRADYSAGTVYAFGEAGNDTIRGGSGNDYLDGGSGQDVVQGGAGDDVLDGETVDGGAGTDHTLTSGEFMVDAGENIVLARSNGEVQRVDKASGVSLPRITNVTKNARGEDGVLYSLDAAGHLFRNGELLIGSTSDFLVASDLVFRVDTHGKPWLHQDGSWEKVYDGTQRVVQMLKTDEGIVTLFSGGGVYFSADGRNLGGGENTIRAYNGSQRIVQMLGTDEGIVTLFSGGGAYFSVDGRDLGGGGETVRAYSGSQRIVEIIQVESGIATLFSGGGVYLSPDGRDLGGGGNTSRLKSETFAIAGSIEGGLFWKGLNGVSQRYTDGDWTDITMFDEDADGKVYWLEQNGTLQRDSDGVVREDIDENVQSFGIHNSGAVFYLTGSGQIGKVGHGILPWGPVDQLVFTKDGEMIYRTQAEHSTHPNHLFRYDAQGQWHHTGNVQSLVRNRDGNVFHLGPNHIVYRNGEQVLSNASNLAIDLNGYVLAIGEQGRIFMWAPTAAVFTTRGGLYGSLNDFFVDPNGNIIGHGTDNQAHLWNVENHQWNAIGRVHSMASDADGAILALGLDQRIYQWLPESKAWHQRHGDGIVKELFIDSRGNILSYGADGLAKQWDVGSQTWSSKRRFTNMTVDKNGYLLAIGTDQRVSMWAPAAETFTNRGGIYGSLNDFFVDPNGNIIGHGTDNQAHLWDVQNHKWQALRSVTNMTVDKNGYLLAIGTDQRVSMWAPAAETFTNRGGIYGSLNDFFVDPNGNIIGHGTDNQAHLWDAQNHKWIATGRVNAMAIDSRNEILALGLDERVYQWLPDSRAWHQRRADGSLKMMFADDNEHIWSIDSKDALKRWNESTRSWENEPGMPTTTIMQFGGIYAIFGTQGSDEVVVSSVPPGTDQLIFYGFDGADQFVNATSFPSEAYGGNGNDSLAGGSSVDRLHGQAGNDTLVGRDGNDTLIGGEDNDLLGTAGIYQTFIHQTGTALHETGDNFHFELADFNGDSHLDLIAIKKSATASNSTEVHVLDGGSGFQRFLLQTSTALHQTGGTFDFEISDYNNDGHLDVFAISTSGTGSNSTEVHILNGATGYKSWLLQTGTPLHQTGGNFEFEVGDLNQDGITDLFAIKKYATETDSTEVHVLDGASGFQNWILQTGTPLHETGDNFEFAVADWNQDRVVDLVAVKQSSTGSDSTELHVLHGGVAFQAFVQQVGTALHETGANFSFGIHDYNGDGVQDLLAVKKRQSGSNSTEVHVVSGNYIGEAGNDTMDGQDGTDIVIGGAGDDRLFGGSGDDMIAGGVGVDAIWAGEDNDMVWGGAFGDTVGYSDGNDAIDGQAGNDILHGSGGDDHLHGGGGDDVLYGESGNDLLGGAAGNDQLLGGDGHDTMAGGNGDDGMWGGFGNDEMWGGDLFDSVGSLDGNDSMDGQDGSDTLHGSGGDDHLHGGGDNDHLYGDGGNDLIGGAAGMDHLFGGSGSDTMAGGAGDDFMWGGSENDLMWGGDLNDPIGINDGDDAMNGEAGHDLLFGSGGDDHLHGSAGNDHLYGHAGNDLIGGAGDDDHLVGGPGIDTLRGGPGTDSSNTGEDVADVESTGRALSSDGQLGYQYRPTLILTVHGANLGIDSGRGRQHWETKVSEAMEASLESWGSQTYKMRLNWASNAPNDLAIGKGVKGVTAWLSERAQPWNVVIVGHSRGGIAALEIANAIGRPANMGSLHLIMLDPTAAKPWGDKSNYSVANHVDHAVFYDDQQDFTMGAAPITMDSVPIANASYVPVGSKGVLLQSHNNIAKDWYPASHQLRQDVHRIIASSPAGYYPESKDPTGENGIDSNEDMHGFNLTLNAPSPPPHQYVINGYWDIDSGQLSAGGSVLGFSAGISVGSKGVGFEVGSPVLGQVGAKLDKHGIQVNVKYKGRTLSIGSGKGFKIY